MTLKIFLGMYDNWKQMVRVNDNNLNTIIEEEAYKIYESDSNILDKEVVSFGMYDDVLTIRIK